MRSQVRLVEVYVGGVRVEGEFDRLDVTYTPEPPSPSIFPIEGRASISFTAKPSGTRAERRRAARAWRRAAR